MKKSLFPSQACLHVTNLAGPNRGYAKWRMTRFSLCRMAEAPILPRMLCSVLPELPSQGQPSNEEGHESLMAR